MARQSIITQAMRDRDMEALTQTLVEAVRDITSIRSQDTIFNLREVLDDVVQSTLAARRMPENTTVPLGWDMLTNATNGGAEAGDVITLVARPNQGKSYLITHMAHQAWLAGHSVLFVSMEMTPGQIGRRLLAIASGTNPSVIQNGMISTFQLERVMATAETMSGSPVPFRFIGGAFDQTVGVVDNAIQEFSPDVVFIDASYLMFPTGGRGRKNRFELIAEVGQEVKQVALLRRKPIIQTVQFNREARKERGGATLDNIGGSDVIGQISSVVVSINPGPESGEEETTRLLRLLKNREGARNLDFLINFLFAPPDFSYRPRDVDGFGAGARATSDNDGTATPAVDGRSVWG
jgi:replicative DNA helicase